MQRIHGVTRDASVATHARATELEVDVALVRALSSAPHVARIGALKL